MSQLISKNCWQKPSRSLRFFVKLQKKQNDTETMFRQLNLGQPIRKKVSKVRVQNEDCFKIPLNSWHLREYVLCVNSK